MLLEDIGQTLQGVAIYKTRLKKPSILSLLHCTTSSFLQLLLKWQYAAPQFGRILYGAVFLERAICLWRKERYSWRRAQALFFIIDAGSGVVRCIAAAVTTGILETMRLWAS